VIAHRLSTVKNADQNPQELPDNLAGWRDFDIDFASSTRWNNPNQPN